MRSSLAVQYCLVSAGGSAESVVSFPLVSIRSKSEHRVCHHEAGPALVNFGRVLDSAILKTPALHTSQLEQERAEYCASIAQAIEEDEDPLTAYDDFIGRVVRVLIRPQLWSRPIVGGGGRNVLFLWRRGGRYVTKNE